MSDNIRYLPGTDVTVERTPETKTIDFLQKIALDYGWSISRRGDHYVLATRKTDDRTQQVTFAIMGGRLQATRTEILDTTDASDVVVSWLDG